MSLKSVLALIAAMSCLSVTASYAGDEPTSSTWDDAKPVRTSAPQKHEKIEDDCKIRHYASKADYDQCVEVAKASQNMPARQ